MIVSIANVVSEIAILLLEALDLHVFPSMLSLFMSFSPRYTGCPLSMTIASILADTPSSLLVSLTVEYLTGKVDPFETMTLCCLSNPRRQFFN